MIFFLHSTNKITINWEQKVNSLGKIQTHQFTSEVGNMIIHSSKQKNKMKKNKCLATGCSKIEMSATEVTYFKKYCPY